MSTPANSIPAAPGAADPAAAPAKPGRKLKLPLIIAGVAVLAAGGAAGGLYLMKGKQAAAKHEAAKPVHVEPIFVPLDPPFVVNFASNDAVRFLQVTVQAMTEAPLAAELLKKHDPIIRNSLLMLFSGQSYETLSTTAGKEQLRLAALEAVRKVVVEAGGKKDDVKDLYFTSFVMQ